MMTPETALNVLVNGNYAPAVYEEAERVLRKALGLPVRRQRKASYKTGPTK